MVAAPETRMNSLDYVYQGIDNERNGRVQAVYALWEIYRLLPDDPGLPGKPGPRLSLLNEVGSQRNIAADRLEEWLLVPERIPWEMLNRAFAPTPQGEPSWHLSLTWTHLEKVAKVGGVKENLYGPIQRVRWLVMVADNEWSTADLDNYLRKEGHIKARAQKSFTPEAEAKDAERVNLGREAAAYLQKCLAGDYGPEVREKVGKSWTKREAAITPALPDKASGLFRWIADQLEQSGKDIDISRNMAARMASKPDEPIALHVAARWATDRLAQERPDLMGRLGGGTGRE